MRGQMDTKTNKRGDSTVAIKPTPGERLYIWRRRSGMSQTDAAAHYKVHVDRYRAWESDARVKGRRPNQPLGHLRSNEQCVLMRRREKLTQREVAEAIGVSRLWVIMMEDGKAADDRLCQHWGLF
jgi:DNA-binding transcriptional regulator YiaG